MSIARSGLSLRAKLARRPLAESVLKVPEGSVDYVGMGQSCGAAFRDLRVREWVGRRLGAEDAFTLVELLVASTLALVVFAATLTVLDTSARTGMRERERASSIPAGAQSLQRMTRDLRQVYRLVGPLAPASDSNYVDGLVQTPASGGGSTDQRLLYRCDATSPTSAGYRACYRWTSAANSTQGAGVIPAGQPGQLVVDLIANGTSADPVFQSLYYPAGASRPTSGRITLRFPPTGSSRVGYSANVTLTDGFYMRNLDLGR